jgi:hypothetical protein
MGKVTCLIVQMRAEFKSYVDIFPINFGLKESGICGWVFILIANTTGSYTDNLTQPGTVLPLPLINELLS